MTLEDIAIGFVPRLGVRGVNMLCELFGSARAVYAASEEELVKRACLRREVAQSIVRRAGFEEAQRELLYCERNGIRPLAATDEAYPESLRMVPDAPNVLYTMGDVEALASRHMLSVVGTRKMTPYGELMCRRIIEGLAERFPDLVVVSGLALGIDAAAHRAAVSCGVRTVGVIASALPRVTPAQNSNLGREILEHGGAIVTELHSQTKQNGAFYIPRNRIIAALGEGLLLVESPMGGGSISTVQAADGYSRSVMAVPGRATDTASCGANHLIKTGMASLVMSGDDVAEVLGWQADAAERVERVVVCDEPLSEPEAKVVACFEGESDGLHIETLVERSGLPMSGVSAALLNLELSGVVRQLPGKIYELLIR